MALKDIASNLDKQTGTLTDEQNKHILSRCLFGYTKANLDSIKSLTLSEIMSTLLDDSQAMPSSPIVIDSQDTALNVGDPWQTSVGISRADYRRGSLFGWWGHLILEQPINLREKLVLFFSNHIPVQEKVTGNANWLLEYQNILRSNCFGNLKTMVSQLAICPAMLHYLNGTSNQAKKPNENFGRELLELFTLGKGPQVGEGDYTNYTEDDVKAASRVMSGWRVDGTTWDAYYTESRHDITDKVFSAALSSQTISNNGELEYLDLINLLFAQKSTARTFVRKLYRFFVHYHIDTTIETNVIEPLATLLFDGGYDLKPVYEKLFSSKHFFDSNIIGGMIKSPIDFVYGNQKLLEVALPASSDYITKYQTSLWYRGEASSMDQLLGNTPSVAGWEAYYLAPVYHRKWMNSATYPIRQKFLSKVFATRDYSKAGVVVPIHPDWTSLLSLKGSATSGEDIIQALVDFMFVKPIPSTVVTTLGVEYDQLKIDDPMISEEDLLKEAITTLSLMPEYQLG
ncbi:DUF1800 domain-containing protein [bacterium]|nr:DUF1800 domain-containing protein [bacterium]